MAGNYIAIALRNYHGKWLVLETGQGGTHPWRFPGGKPKENEGVFATAERELREETGLGPLHFEHVGSFTNVVDGVEWKGIFVQCDSYIGEPKIPEEELKKHPSFRWVTTWELYELKAHPEFEAAVKIILKETGRK